MGLQSQLHDVGSDSIPILLVALIATCLSHLRSLLAAVCHSLPRRLHHHIVDENFLHISSGLAGLIAISDHRLSLRPFRYHRQHHFASAASDEPPVCVFCLCHLKSGDSVCKLPCNHIFHNHIDCLGGWLDQMKFSCPVCRSPIISGWRVDQTQRRVASDLATHFAVRNLGSQKER
ncbi:hypothetical protein Cgig2_031673 [Carnegiea gigantea]|uniref:RING-type domain-containing protein n=1 Tax=Carnegiea gigantea TaxID=171969 RepID=A0A9Q1KQ35_9CARY|nr:hypothetical protein Cgig2_031673 [Carnegiea gigantea]